VFRDATPLALAFAWLEPYRALTNIATIRFTDGTMLRIRRGKFLEMKKDEDIFPHEPCIPQVRAHAPIMIRGGISTEIMMRPFPNTWWLVGGSMLMGPPIGIQQPNAQAKANTLMAYGVTKVVMLQFSQEEGKTFEGMEETIISLGEKTKARGWKISISWNIINSGKEETNAHAGRILDAILAARPDYGILYVCVDSPTMEYITWLWRRYYKFLAGFIRPEDLTENPRIPSSLTLWETMKVPPLGYPVP